MLCPISFHLFLCLHGTVLKPNIPSQLLGQHLSIVPSRKPSLFTALLKPLTAISGSCKDRTLSL